MDGLSRISKYIYESIMTLAAPRRCLACGDWITDKEMILCFDCLQSLKFFTPQYYDAFTAFKPSRNVPISPHWEHIFPLVVYEAKTPESKFVINLKDHSSLNQRLTAGIMLGSRIKLYYKTFNTPIDFDMIIPAPLLWSREKERGYSQTADIAQGLGRVLGVEVRTDIVSNEGEEFKFRSSLMQAEDKDKIRTNKYILKGNEKELIGKHILIFDDQITSGGTIAKLCELLYAKAKGDIRFSIASISLSPNCIK